MNREIQVDRKLSASLRTPTSTMLFPNSEAAVKHWHQLSAEEQAHTALSLATGEIYQPPEIELIRFID